MVSQWDFESTDKFNGSNWQTLNRLVALANFQFAQDDDYDSNAPRQCSYLAGSFTGPALDWVASRYAAAPNTFPPFNRFVEETREAFGIADNNITALLRRELDDLSWQSDTPVFFSEFDRITHALGITSHETRVAMVEAKLPTSMKTLLASQALSFANYETMRERFNCMWAMDPSKTKKVTHPAKKPRCGSCGKKGHTATDCRSKN
jgi:hypothetical protein